jgi:apolipoprotein N-acyltransferase
LIEGVRFMPSTDANFPDPYAPAPKFWQRHAEYLAALAVFIFTVVLTVLAFPPYQTPEFAYAFLVPAIFWAYTRPRLKLYVWTMFAAQAVAWTLLLGWLRHVTWGGLFLLGPLVGAWVGVWFLAAWWTMPRMLGRPTVVRLVAMLGLAAVWAIVEWTRTWLFGGFPWLPLAASQWTMVSMLQIAAYTGAYGISFVVVAVNIGFAAYAHRLFREGRTGLNKRSQEFFLALFLVLICFSLHLTETFGRGRFTQPLARVALVQPYIPQEVKWDPAKGRGILDVLEKTTLEAAALRPDLILWPEAVTPWAVRGNADVRGAVESLVKRAKTPLLLGSIAIENPGQPSEQWFNGAFLVSPDFGLAPSYYAKRHLVPFGEYVPLRPLFGWLKKVVPIGDDFMRGLDSSPLILPLRGTSVTIGPLICYEDIFPTLARASAQIGSDVLTVLTNDAWYGEGGAAYQHAAHSVLRAVETRRPVLRCGNGGWSGWIDEFGAVRFTATESADNGTIYFRGARDVKVSRDARWVGQQSFYVLHGDWFILLCGALVVFGGALLANAPAAVKELSPPDSVT